MQPGDTIQPENKSGDNGVEVTIPRDQEKPVAVTSEFSDQATPEPPPAEVPKASQGSTSTPAESSPSPELAPAVSSIDQDDASESPDPESEPTDSDLRSTPWQYKGYEETALTKNTYESGPITWSASEFVDHEKSSSWFISLAALSGAFVTIIFLITRDIATVVVIALAAILFGITAGRKPRTLQYQITGSGINIGNKFYPYNILKTFSVLEEGAFNSIQLTPLKRFMPPISLYYPPEQEVKIIEMLANYLPHEERTHDPIDRLMRRVRF